MKDWSEYDKNTLHLIHTDLIECKDMLRQIRDALTRERWEPLPLPATTEEGE